jgi:hypothetical protein
MAARKNAGQRRIHLCACGDEGHGSLCGVDPLFASLSCDDSEGIVCGKCQKKLIKLCKDAAPPLPLCYSCKQPTAVRLGGLPLCVLCVRKAHGGGDGCGCVTCKGAS